MVDAVDTDVSCERASRPMKHRELRASSDRQTLTELQDETRRVLLGQQMAVTPPSKDGGVGACMDEPAGIGWAPSSQHHAGFRRRQGCAVEEEIRLHAYSLARLFARQWLGNGNRERLSVLAQSSLARLWKRWPGYGEQIWALQDEPASSFRPTAGDSTAR